MIVFSLPAVWASRAGCYGDGNQFRAASRRPQRGRKLLAVGLDPQTIERIDGVIRKWFRPAYALTGNRSPLEMVTCFPLRSGRKARGS
jgi:hypothetical protein